LGKIGQIGNFISPSPKDFAMTTRKNRTEQTAKELFLEQAVALAKGRKLLQHSLETLTQEKEDRRKEKIELLTPISLLLGVVRWRERVRIGEVVG
jgi:hypothetical protein